MSAYKSKCVVTCCTLRHRDISVRGPHYLRKSQPGPPPGRFLSAQTSPRSTRTGDSRSDLSAARPRSRTKARFHLAFPLFAISVSVSRPLQWGSESTTAQKNEVGRCHCTRSSKRNWRRRERAGDKYRSEPIATLRSLMCVLLQTGILAFSGRVGTGQYTCVLAHGKSASMQSRLFAARVLAR